MIYQNNNDNDMMNGLRMQFSLVRNK